MKDATGKENSPLQEGGGSVLRWYRDGALLEVRLRPGSSRQGLEGVVNGRLVVAVHSPPSKGRANQESLKVLSRALRLSPSRLQIVSGSSSRNKTVLIRGLSESEACSLLEIISISPS